MNERIFRRLAEDSPFFIGICDTSFNVIFVNDAGRLMVGLEAGADLDALRIEDFIFPEDRDEVLARFLSNADHAHHGETDVRFRHFKTGEALWVMYTVFPLTGDNGDCLGYAIKTRDISLRRAAETALARSAAEFRSLFELSAAGAAQSDLHTGKLLRVNERFCEITGYTAQELLERSYFDLTHPEDRRVDENQLNAVLRGERDRWESEKRYVRADGSSVWVHVVGRLVCDDDDRPYCTIANILDITDRKHIEDALRESEQRFKTMADTAPSMLWVTDEKLNCTFLSRGWFEYTGQTEAEGYGAGWRQAVHPDDRPDANAVFVAAASRREPFSVDYRLRRHDGTYRWAIDAGRPRLSEAGELIGYIGSVTDAHQRKEAEEALQRANDQLEARVQERTKELQRRALQLSRLTSELTLTEQRERQRIAQVLHDHLQQLLVAASLRLSVLGRSATERQKKSVNELSELLEEAIRASRSLTVELAPPILHEAGLSAGLKWLARWMQEKHGLVVHVQADDDATGEPEDVRILLFHSVRELLFNIVKHAGSPIATVELRLVRKRYLKVTVADQGAGFDPERIFSEDQRASSGIGLFSIRERLSMLGGRLEIGNNPTGGSVITMIAPIQPVHSASPQKTDRIGTAGRAGERVAKRRRRPDGARIRILLVDDHEVMRQGVRSILMDEPDMEVTGEASNGVEAIEQAHMIQPDVILMDFSMPEMNGLEATRRIASELPHVKIIGLSMYEEHEQAAAMLNAGASDYRTKSGNMEQLLDTIRAVYQAAEAKPSGQ